MWTREGMQPRDVCLLLDAQHHAVDAQGFLMDVVCSVGGTGVRGAYEGGGAEVESVLLSEIKAV